MDDDHPWGTYAKDQLPSGLAYPLGRDAIEIALRDADAQVGALYLSVPKLNPPNDPPEVVRLYWRGVGQWHENSYHSPAQSSDKQPKLIMWVFGVQSADRSAIRGQLEGGMFDRFCRRAAELASDLDSAAVISERDLYVIWDGADLRESSTWPIRRQTKHSN